MGYAFLGVGEYAYFIFSGGYVGNIWLLWVGEYANPEIGYENSRVGEYAKVQIRKCVLLTRVKKRNPGEQQTVKETPWGSFVNYDEENGIRVPLNSIFSIN